MITNERPIPEAAKRDPDSVEMLRVWIAEEGLHCSMKVGMYEESTDVREEKAWGKILADVTRHLADALDKGYGRDRASAVRGIVDAFLEEIEKPSRPRRGGFVERH